MRLGAQRTIKLRPYFTVLSCTLQSVFTLLAVGMDVFRYPEPDCTHTVVLEESKMWRRYSHFALH